MGNLTDLETSTTPKLRQKVEIHQTTIMEENETMRGSLDRALFAASPEKLNKIS